MYSTLQIIALIAIFLLFLLQRPSYCKKTNLVLTFLTFIPLGLMLYCATKDDEFKHYPIDSVYISCGLVCLIFCCLIYIRLTSKCECKKCGNKPCRHCGHINCICDYKRCHRCNQIDCVCEQEKDPSDTEDESCAI